MGDENKVRDAADAIKGIVEAIPVYQDALQPAVREIGQGLHVLSKTVNIALAPVRALVWGWDKIELFVAETVARKLEGVPADRIVTPEPHVVVPAIEALRYVGEQPELRDLFANLLAASLDSATSPNAHPGFVEIIKNMSPDEARILKVFEAKHSLAALSLRASVNQSNNSYLVLARRLLLVAQAAGCTAPQLEATYLDNLQRLGLIEEVGGFGHLSGPTLTDKALYEALETSDDVRSARISAEKHGSQLVVTRGAIRLTDLGQQFCAVCIGDHSALAQQSS